ncbi:MAG: hypothetical protein K8R89_01525 [Anaerolineae bacterium]|nr:hypothetical protein [Anaerolineae bacterium]
MKEPFNWDTVTLRLNTPLHKYHQYQGKTNNCGPTSLAIVANAIWGQTRLQGPRVAQELSTPRFRARPIPHPVVRRIPNWATFPWGLVDYLRQQEIPARWATGSVSSSPAVCSRSYRVGWSLPYLARRAPASARSTAATSFTTLPSSRSTSR